MLRLIWEANCATTKGIYMRLVIVVVLFLVVCIVSGAAHADFIEFTKEPVTREERIIKTQVEKHKIPKEDIHAYIFNDMDSIVDRIEIPKKPKGDEHYAKNN